MFREEYIEEPETVEIEDEENEAEGGRPPGEIEIKGIHFKVCNPGVAECKCK